MGYVPGCSADVFISYAHADNHDGWVTRLVLNELTPKLKTPLADTEVWFDESKIESGDYFEQNIKNILKNTPIFAAVVSPRYVASDFCMLRELQWFQDQGGTEIIQLIAVPLDEAEVPLPKVGYDDLYDKLTGRPLVGRALGRALDKPVLAMTNKLRACWDARPKVYVAQLRDEALEDLRERLHREGYAILPKGLLLGRTADSRIRERLEAADVSFHLSCADDELARRQLAIAQRLGKAMIIRDRPPHGEEIANVIAEVESTLKAHRKPSVYIIYDHHTDGERAAGLCEPIKHCTGCQVWTPLGGETLHKQRLKQSAGILLYRSDAAPEEWLESQKDALLQAAALRGDRLATEAWYFTHRPNGSPAGSVHRMQGPAPRAQWIIERTGEPNLEDLQPFFEALRPRIKHAAGGQAG